MTCPCKDCKKRCVGCHGKCRNYKTWKRQYIYAVRKNRTGDPYEGSYQEKEHIRYLKRHS